MTAYIIDTETTDADANTAEVIELATMPFDNLHKYVVEAKRFNPVRTPISFGALSVHHILPEELHDCLPSSSAALPADCQYIIGHNVDFDWRVLGSPPVRRIDTLAMARSLWPTLDSHKLGALVYYLNGVTAGTKELLVGAHSAGTDVNLCHLVLDGILKTQPWIGTVEQLWEFSEACRIPTVMTFGKFKGKPVSAVDRGWIGWYRKQEETDPYLLEAFRRLGK